jgi:hypothetical protein
MCSAAPAPRRGRRLPVAPVASVALLCAALGAASPLAQGCGGRAEARAPDAEARAVAEIDTRLRGAWVLQSFTSETPLEPMLEALLQFQFGRLVARLDGKRLVAESSGIHVDRAYRVSEVAGDQFKLTTYDDEGVPYESVCTFLPDGAVQIHSLTSPWKGMGLVRRAGP